MKKVNCKLCSKNMLLVIIAVFVLTVTIQSAWAYGQVKVSTDVSFFEYEEPDIMKEDGIMYGVSGRYDIQTLDSEPISSLDEIITYYKDNYVLALDSSFYYGQLDYTSTSTGKIDDIDNYLFEMRALTGYDFATEGNVVFTPYVGFGYRYLLDDNGGAVSTTSHYGYDRESNYYYVPIGLDTDFDINSGWKLILNAEYDIFISGKQKSHLEDVSPTYNTLENDQNDGYGVRGSVKVAKEAEMFNFFVEGFVRYWEIDDSSIGTVTCGGVPCALGYEPKNQTTQYGLKAGVSF